MDYHSFIAGKREAARQAGVEVQEASLARHLFGFQRAIVLWALRQGRAALFAGCGLGKTPMQLEWARIMCAKSGGPALIVAPLAVSKQTVREGQKFGVEVRACRSQADVRPGINITNYEMIEHFDPTSFKAVVLDESSILKSLTGKTKIRLIEMFERVQYRLACTATPAPNDHTELGNHAEFLGIMRTPEMLCRWFINDGFDAGVWRLKGHARADFWRWVSSWAVCLTKPSDIGYSDEGYALPPLTTIPHVVSCGDSEIGDGRLVRTGAMSATETKREMRKTIAVRAAKAAELVATMGDEPAVVWCDLNDEAAELLRLIPEAREVSGAMTLERKESVLEDFSSGRLRVLIAKPRIAGFGLNWQHCRNTVFVGASYSFEARYQAVRRFWRFGQEREVFDHIIMSHAEAKVFNAVLEKERKHVEMERSMSGAVNEVTGYNMGRGQVKAYHPAKNMTMPRFLKGTAA